MPLLLLKNIYIYIVFEGRPQYTNLTGLKLPKYTTLASNSTVIYGAGIITPSHLAKFCFVLF